MNFDFDFDVGAMKAIFVVIGTILAALLGGWNIPLIAAVSFICLDYLAAWGTAVVTGKFDSSVGYRGFAKKFGYLLAIAGAQLFDTYILQAPVTRTATCIAFALNDAGSFFGHVYSWGVPLPKMLTDALQSEIARKANRGSPTTNKDPAA